MWSTVGLTLTIYQVQESVLQKLQQEVPPVVLPLWCQSSFGGAGWKNRQFWAVFTYFLLSKVAEIFMRQSWQQGLSFPQEITPRVFLRQMSLRPTSAGSLWPSGGVTATSGAMAFADGLEWAWRLFGDSSVPYPPGFLRSMAVESLATPITMVMSLEERPCSRRCRARPRFKHFYLPDPFLGTVMEDMRTTAFRGLSGRIEAII